MATHSSNFAPSLRKGSESWTGSERDQEAEEEAWSTYVCMALRAAPGSEKQGSRAGKQVSAMAKLSSVFFGPEYCGSDQMIWCSLAACPRQRDCLFPAMSGTSCSHLKPQHLPYHVHGPSSSTGEGSRAQCVLHNMVLAVMNERYGSNWAAYPARCISNSRGIVPICCRAIGKGTMQVLGSEIPTPTRLNSRSKEEVCHRHPLPLLRLLSTEALHRFYSRSRSGMMPQRM